MVEIGKAFFDLYKAAENDPAYWAAGAELDFTIALNERMQQLGMSRADLAKAIGTSPAYVTKLLRGDANFTITTMAKVAFAVGTHPTIQLLPIEASSLFPSEMSFGDGFRPAPLRLVSEYTDEVDAAAA